MKKIKPICLIFILILFANCNCNNTEKNIKNQELVICSFGGSFQESQRKAFFEPFEKLTGIKIKEVNYSGEYSKIKAMVMSGNVDFDIVDVELGTFLSGVKDSAYEKIDYKKIKIPGLMDVAKYDYGIATDFYSTGIGYNKKNSSKIPNSWKEFWDIKSYPGTRALRKNPYTLLEMALLADGVPEKSLYPLDVERAFKSLDKIKKSIKVWWTTGQQPIQLLTTNEVDFTSVWSGRIWSAKHSNNLSLEFSYNQAFLEPEIWVILKGAKNKENALKFIEFASQAKQQAEMTKLFGTGPVNKDAFKYLDNTMEKEIPTSAENLKKQIMVNGKWWAQNQDKIAEKWEEWLIK